MEDNLVSAFFYADNINSKVYIHTMTPAIYDKVGVFINSFEKAADMQGVVVIEDLGDTQYNSKAMVEDLLEHIERINKHDQ